MPECSFITQDCNIKSSKLFLYVFIELTITTEVSRNSFSLSSIQDL